MQFIQNKSKGGPLNVPRNFLRFPVVHEFTVSNYQLYPGGDEDGLSYTVKPGVNIVVGVNGLGKTTLLNLLLKMVAGTWEIRAPEGLGMGSRNEVRTGTRYFAARVTDAAANATATATLGFGETRLSVTRRLSNLSIISMQVNGIIEEGLLPDEFEQRFRQEILNLSGLKQYYDYLLLVHFIFFFLEDRQALIWDEDAQSEILRVLYYNPDQHVAYRTLYNQIAQIDSEIRNTEAVLRRHEKKINVELAKRAGSDTARELLSLKKTLDELRNAIGANESKAEEINDERLSYRNKLEMLKVQREQKISESREVRERFLETQFAQAETDALYAVASIVGERGCILCGSASERSRAAVLQRLFENHCPLCDADNSERETSTPLATDESLLDAIQKIETEIVDLRKMIANLDVLLQHSTSSYENVMVELASQRSQHQEIRLEVDVLQRGLPSNDEDLKNLQDNLLGVRNILDNARAEKSEAESSLAEIITTGESAVAAVASSIIQRFREYITGFMAENCNLQYEVRERAVGQGKATVKFRFPCFSVQLTSGVFKDSGSSRLTAKDVSESQREFIDLAFRMSIIAEITERCAAMLVMETPEASLDSVFVPRAGKMIRQFLNVTQVHPNFLVASTNLNREAMIPALFGVMQDHEAELLANSEERTAFDLRISQATPRSERPGRIVNLLEIAAKNAALVKYGDEYRYEFENAVFPPWEEFDVARALSK